MQHDEDLELVRRLMARDRRAFEVFFDTYFPRLYRFCVVRIQDESRVEDVVQETLIRALRNVAGYRGEAALFTWLCQICRNQITTHYRRTGRIDSLTVSLDDDPSVRAALESLAVHEAVDPADRLVVTRMVQLTLDHLPERYGAVLEWKYVEGLSVDEIALRMQTGVVAAQSTLARARRAFRSGFEDLQRELAGT